MYLTISSLEVCKHFPGICEYVCLNLCKQKEHKEKKQTNFQSNYIESILKSTLGKVVLGVFLF